MDDQNGFAQVLYDHIEVIIQNIPRERRTQTLTQIKEVFKARPSTFFKRRLLLFIERILVVSQIENFNKQFSIDKLKDIHGGFQRG